MPPRLDITIDAAKLKGQPVQPEVLQILKIIRPGWLQDSIQAKAFTGGISNVLYGYYEEGKFSEDVVLVRIEGEGNDLMWDRKKGEKEHAGLCAPLYALFNNGMAYGYVAGETVNIKTVRNKTVRKYTENIPPKDVLEREGHELWEHLEALNSPIVFCHNDLLLENITYNEEKDSIHFIDYEVAMYNYEHYDIGAHFAEYAGTDVDNSRYPDKEYQLDWIRCYLECKAEQNGGSAADVTDRDIEECYVKTNKFALASHFVAGTWGLVQAKVSKLDFDFLKYASVKLGEYFARKEEFFALQVPK